MTWYIERLEIRSTFIWNIHSIYFVLSAGARAERRLTP